MPSIPFRRGAFDRIGPCVSRLTRRLNHRPPHVYHRPLFLAAILHADVMLIVASVPRMIFQTGLLILAAQFAVLRLLSSRYRVGAERNNQH